MINKFKFYITGIFVLLFNFCFAQNNPTVLPSSDFMKSNGKIYVVVAIVLVILFGLFTYVWNLDKKLKKLEKDLTNKK